MSTAAATIDLDDLKGVKRAATLIVAIGPERASEILRHLPEEDVERISTEIASFPRISAETCAEIVKDTVSSVQAEGYAAEGGLDYAREVLTRSLDPERAAQIVARLAAALERRPFEFLRRTPAEQIHVFLRNESPQTIALVVANLHTALAAQVLCLFSPAEQADVSHRLAMMGETQPEVVAQIESVMRKKLASVSEQDSTTVGGIEALADILNHSDRTTERNVLEEIAKANAGLAEEVRLLLFTFEDVATLDDRSIQMILKEVDQKDLALALRGVSEDVAGRIFKNMSERGAENLREEIAYQPPQRRSVVEESQGRIVAVVRRLEEAGSIVLSRAAAGGEDQLV